MIYSWFKRLDTDESFEQAATNVHHARRRRKLPDKKQDGFEKTTHGYPERDDLDAPASTPALVQQYPDETYDVEYSIPSCRRLLKEAGLSYQKPRPTAAESDAEEQETFREELKKSGGRWTPQ